MGHSLGDGIRAAGLDEASMNARADDLVDYMKSAKIDWATALHAVVKLVDPGMELTAAGYFLATLELEAARRKRP